jgi:tRNA(fMet)-specific endonuclease VapC
MYLLDTNTCIRVLRNSAPAVVARLRSRAPDEVALCSVVKAELYFGARRSARVQENLAAVAAFCVPFQSLPFGDVAAEHYGTIRADLSRSGCTIGPNDLLIAAIARAHDATLVTHNTSEFRRVVGLRLEDWEVPATPPPHPGAGP